MKKLIAFALIAVILLGLAACGTINESEVAILWSGDGVVHVPNSLINTMERAMYIENIAYAHYGANGDQATQTAQAKEALENGCAALAVELVDAAAAQEILDAAKAKNVPVVFFNCGVEESVVSGYDKCVLVNTDQASLPQVSGEMISSALYTEKKGVVTLEYDRNEDGKITYAAFGDVTATVAVINSKLAEKGLPALEAASGDSIDAVIGTFTEESAPVELILTADDAIAQEVLVALQAKGYNKDRLNTHCIPVYTVGNNADYKALVLAGRPAGDHEDDNVQDYFKSMQYIVDLRSVQDEDLDSMLYTTGDIIGDGRLAGAAVEDYDAISVAVAEMLSNMLKGETVESQINKIPYTTISG